MSSSAPLEHSDCEKKIPGESDSSWSWFFNCCSTRGSYVSVETDVFANDCLEDGPDAPKAKEALMALWRRLLAEKRPCTFNEFPNLSENYRKLLGAPLQDLHSEEHQKRVSGQGAVCLVRLQWYNHPYSGLFRRADYGLARFSSALPANLDAPECPIMGSAPGSLKEAVVIPFVAFKFFRADNCSKIRLDAEESPFPGCGTLLFGGRKTGQKEWDYFSQPLASTLTERCSLILRPILRSFQRYSKYPTHTGLSDFASYSQNGSAVPSGQIRFPWALLLRPVVATRDSHPCNYLKQLQRLPAGVRLYEMFACDNPSEAVTGPLHHIGDVVSCSKFVESSLERRLRFRHQLKEEDYEVRPQWKEALTPEHKNYGWEHLAALHALAHGTALRCTNWQE